MSKVVDRLGREIMQNDICAIFRAGKPIEFGKISYIGNWNYSVDYNPFPPGKISVKQLLNTTPDTAIWRTIRKPADKIVILKRETNV